MPARATPAQVYVYIAPAYGEWLTGTQVSVSIEYCAYSEQFDGPGYVVFNGQDVSSEFPFTSAPPGGSCYGATDYGTAQGTVTLVSGQNTLNSGISTWTQSGQATATYTGTAPPPPDTWLDAPTGDVTVQYPLIKVHWCGASLNAGSRWIKVNTVDKTASFDYVTVTPVTCAAEATSQTTTVPLNMGANTVEAHICDNTGNCTTETFIVRRVAPGVPVLSLKNHNPDHLDRSLCQTTGGGEGAAVPCGDLQVVHGLPAYRTLGRTRALALIYHSATAAPRPAVAVWVKQPDSVQTPDSVYAELQISGVKRASAWYYAWGGDQRTRQLVLGADSSLDAFASGLYPFTFLVRYKYATTVPDQIVSGEVLVVNRRASEFGAGWGLAGVERLVFGQTSNRLLWVGGDGSAAVYDSIGAGVWRRVKGAFRDSLVRFDSSGTWYRRRLAHRVLVTFNAQGRHRWTTNRLGNATTFGWSTNGDTLKTITVPPAGAPATTYTLTFVAGKLDRITDPAGRVLDATITNGNLVSLIDPDGVAVSFGYDATKRLTSRINRRGYTTTFTYVNLLRVTKVETPLSTQADLAATLLTHWNEQGLAVGNVTGRRNAADTALVYTRVDGPRTDVADVTTFWLDRWGAPVKIRDPLGYETVITRGDTANPALATRVKTPDGRIVGSAYDAPRARLVWTADSTYEGTGTTQTVTTSYLYGSTGVPDSPTEVQSPSGTTKFAYDTTLGLPDSVIAPGGHRTKFAYILAGPLKGLVQSVTERAVRVVDTMTWNRDTAHLTVSFLYDAWGNDSITTSPLGAQIRYEDDIYRRVIRVRDPLNHRTEHFYDLLNRDTAVVVFDSVGIKTRYTYTRTGAPDSVLDQRSVKRTLTYDAGDRATAMKDDVGATETRYVGKSGLLDSLRTRTAELIRHRYDAAGRRTAAIYPAHVNTFSTPTGHNLTVAGDSLAWTYDAVGRPLTVTRFSSTIEFAYNKEGTVKTERQIVKDDNGVVVGDNTMRYWYDTAGRRIRFFNGTDTVFYTYGADGRLSKLKVRWVVAPPNPPQPADSFFFFWDGLGRRDSLVYATPQVHMTFGYDRDGRLRSVCSKHLAPHPNASDRLEQRVRYTSMDADGLPLAYRRYYGGTTSSACSATTLPYTLDFVDLTYDARHQLRTTTGPPYNSYTYDASGNRVRSSLDSLAYLTGTNRVDRRWGVTGNPPQLVLERTLYHDANGSRTRDLKFSGQWTSGAQLYYYNALGQQWAVEPYGVGTVGCRYDALGRQTRVCDPGLVSGRSAFDHDNVVRAGSNWRFVHGPGLDDPLVGLHYWAPNWLKFFYLTDGHGRSLAFTDSVGNDYLGHVTYTQNGGYLAGTIERSHTFANSRMEAASVPGLSFYRNRYYDQNTGRWTQEDPIGFLGGGNLYAYVGNNPAAYTDPYGTFLPGLFAAIGFVAVFVAEAAGGAALGAALATAATALGAAALGSAAAAGIESLVSGRDFVDVFWRSFDVAGGLLAVGASIALLPGVQYVGAGAHTFLQGYVRVEGSPFGLGFLKGGLTLGGGASFTVSPSLDAVTRTAATVAAHEIGHTMQFIGLSALGTWVSPWLPYVGLGALGLVRPTINPWENFASWLGRSACGRCGVE